MEKILVIGLFLICAVVAVLLYNFYKELDMVQHVLYELLADLGYVKMFGEGEKGGTANEHDND